MITKDLEIVFKAAFQEAKDRRHEFVCIEHLLLALLEDNTAHDAIVNCGGDVDILKAELEEFLSTRMETLPEGTNQDPEQTVGFTRVIQRAFIHAQSAEKNEIQGSDLLVAIYREQESYALYLLEKQGVTRFDLINYVSHGVSKIGEEEPAPFVEEEEETERGGAKRDPLEAFTVNLVEKAAGGHIDPLIGRGNEINRTIHVLCRRRKNNPIYVGEPGVGKNRDRGGPGAQDSSRGSSRGPSDDADFCPGYGCAPRRDEVSGRVRGPLEGHCTISQGEA